MLAALHLRGDIDDLHRAADELGHLFGFQRLAAQLGQIVELAGEQNAALVLLAGGELFNRPAAAVEHDAVFGRHRKFAVAVNTAHVVEAAGLLVLHQHHRHAVVDQRLDLDGQILVAARLAHQLGQLFAVKRRGILGAGQAVQLGVNAAVKL